MAKKNPNPIHPGHVLVAEFLAPMEISQYRLAKDIHVPARRINEIVHGKRAITADTALRLARYFSNSPEFWLNLQSAYQLDLANQDIGKKLVKEITPAAASWPCHQESPLEERLIEKVHSPGAFKLTNSGDLSIFFVGCGSAFSRSMNQNNLLVVKGEQHLLVDCGTKSPQALHDLHIEPSELENFLITHTHADHIGGLEEMMMVNRYLNGKKPTIIINEEFEDILWNHSLRGGSAYSEVHDGAPLGFADFWKVIRPTQITEVRRETWETQLGALNIKMPRTKHFPDNAESWRDSFWSCGVLFDERVLFTADTRFDPDLLVEFDERYNLEFIFHDCQFFTGGVHASLDELSTLPDNLKQKMVLMHYGDNWRQYEDEVRTAGFHSFAKQNHSYTFK